MGGTPEVLVGIDRGALGKEPFRKMAILAGPRGKGDVSSGM